MCVKGCHTDMKIATKISSLENCLRPSRFMSAQLSASLRLLQSFIFGRPVSSGASRRTVTVVSIGVIMCTCYQGFTLSFNLHWILQTAPDNILFVTNEPSHPDHLDESTIIFKIFIFILAYKQTI